MLVLNGAGLCRQLRMSFRARTILAALAPLLRPMVVGQKDWARCGGWGTAWVCALWVAWVCMRGHGWM